MRVDCYNACECPVDSLAYGDTCYYEGRLWIKARDNTINMRLDDVVDDDCVLVALDNGEMYIADKDLRVILADTKVVANTKDAF